MDKYTIIFDFDDTGKFIAKTKEGAFVSNPKKAGEWLSPIEIMQQEGIAGKVWDDNPNGGDKVGGLGAWDFSNLKKDDGGGAKVQIHPSAAKAAGA